MTDKGLAEKEEYFREQELLQLSDDEKDFPDDSFLRVGRMLADSKAMPSSVMFVRRMSNYSFLGPTPKERRAEFEEHATRRRSTDRLERKNLAGSKTAPEAEITSFPITKPGKDRPDKKLKRTLSLPTIESLDQTPFYKQLGTIPRELKNTRNTKQTENINLDPEHKQLLKRKIVYFYPNDDVSLARRRRIHKIIQLGAAWVTRWRDDITHVMVDEGAHTYQQLLGYLNAPALPRRVVLVNFDPYIPQCIQFGALLDPTAGRFLVKGAPRPSVPSAPNSSIILSQASLPIKASQPQVTVQCSQKAHPVSARDGMFSTVTTPPSAPSSHLSEIVKDSFITPPSPTQGLSTPAVLLNDPLSKAIQVTKAISHLLFNEDEEDRCTSYSDSDLETGVESSQPLPKKRRTTRPTVSPKSSPSKCFNESAFQCMSPSGNTSLQNPNARTIQVLEDMCKYYDQMQDSWRTFAYRKGISTLKKQANRIRTAKEAVALPFIGASLADKIEEIVLTDRLRKLDNTCDDPTDKALRLFLGIYGAGLRQASLWIHAGHRSISDLVNNAKITESQKVGIEHYEDFNSRILRSEVAAYGAFVREALFKIDPDCEVTIMGSYRRGAKDSGDIDLILTKPAVSLSALRTIVFESLVPSLFRANFLKVSLATSHRSNNGSKWHGASCLPGSSNWRRLDLLLVPEDELGAAFLYFTGNDIFNRSMRLLASKKRMRLNQHGLYKDVVRGRNREKLNKGTLVEGRSERRIFEALGVPWREPIERIC